MRKKIFGNKITKVAFSPQACVCIFLHTQLGFQKHEKDKFSTIMAEVWNESHIDWKPLQTPFFPLYKALHGAFSKHIEIPREKPKIYWKNLRFTRK